MPWGLSTGALIPLADDGIVSTLSGTGLDSWGAPVDFHQTDENHNAFGWQLYDWTYFNTRISIPFSWIGQQEL